MKYSIVNPSVPLAPVKVKEKITCVSKEIVRKNREIKRKKCLSSSDGREGPSSSVMNFVMIGREHCPSKVFHSDEP